ncbi:DUF4159 domain-containing protein [Polycladidibacter stylochi]|uniref:DUF4159 domain-containing protein n=1 Tax=Polycladidibacter stylochi TaxID=1807766 RepID=UPI00082D9A9E|nr:DUF4159 domain-containing protein [Pseudovibrio stylochi]
MLASLLPISFTSYWVLSAFIVLPALWWVLKAVPPLPKQESFPPLRLLASLRKTEETPAKTPWWLLLLRLTIAALIILACAGPIWQPLPPMNTASKGPLWLLLDNSWDAEPNWPQFQSTANALISQAAAENRRILLVPLANTQTTGLALQDAQSTREKLKALTPYSWNAALENWQGPLASEAKTTPPAAIYWLATPTQKRGDEQLYAQLKALTPSSLTIYTPQNAPMALTKAINTANALSITALRMQMPTQSLTQQRTTLYAYDKKGHRLTSAPLVFESGETTATAQIKVPVELRNDIEHITIAHQNTAATTYVQDYSQQRKRLAIFSGTFGNSPQPLLSPEHYLTKALAPNSEIVTSRVNNLPGAIDDVLSKGISVLILADVGNLPPNAHNSLKGWVQRGGTLLRFAGPRLASDADDLIPVQLRHGGRMLGGSLTWSKPQSLASFNRNGIFAPLTLPQDITVTEQVLAEPGPSLTQKTLASLADGTPLVTSSPMGNGRLILFHTTADTSWSNLPLSGSFVAMLGQIVKTSGTIPSTANSGAQQQSLSGNKAAPTSNQNQFIRAQKLVTYQGKLRLPASEPTPVTVRQLQTQSASHTMPPGLYGNNTYQKAVNLYEGATALLPSALATTPNSKPFPSQNALPLQGWLLALALLLLCIDSLITLWPNWQRFSKAALPILVFMLLLLPAPWQTPANANEQNDTFALDATLDSRLAFVKSGDDTLDATSRAGLYGLTRILTRRTALEPEAPVGVDLERDELAFFSFLYWPVTENAPIPSAQAMSRISTFMNAGGTILFDTRDQGSSFQGAARTPAQLKLQQILSTLDIPPLAPVAQGHVLTKTFYLLDNFPGRFTGSPLWGEATAQATANTTNSGNADGVSALLITANDMAGAWAMNNDGSYMFPTVPNDPIQRELAYRVGVNIVIYTMTGNYKADQVHIPALLQRLGH